jgi:hypothetical protein
MQAITSIGLTADVAQSIANWSNLAVSKKTWSTYKTAEQMLKKCSLDCKIQMDLPLGQKQILTFIDWLARVRGLKCSTIESYLAGIRQLHIVTGLQAPVLRSDLVKLVLKGISHRDGIAYRQRNWEGRLPMTLNAMLLFKSLIRTSSFAEPDKALIWAVSTIAFARAFRIHEILSKTESTFDPIFTLLTDHISWSSDAGQEVLHIKLNCPKESKSAAPTIVDIYQNDGSICPIRAFKKWFRLKPRAAKMPLFRWQDGTPFTGRKLNQIMKKLLGPHTDPDIGFFSTHSFRIGIATMLGQAGFEDQEIMATGRWSSRVFERYIRLARTRRAAAHKKISNLDILRK